MGLADTGGFEGVLAADSFFREAHRFADEHQVREGVDESELPHHIEQDDRRGRVLGRVLDRSAASQRGLVHRVDDRLFRLLETFGVTRREDQTQVRELG